MPKRSARGKTEGKSHGLRDGSTPGLRPIRKRWLPLAAILVGCGVLGAVLIEWTPLFDVTSPDLERPRPLSRPNRLSPEAAAEFLGLPTDVPDSVEALKAESMRTCKRLVEDLPDRPEAYAVMALTHKRFGDTTQAVECWQRSLELDPEFSPAFFGQASVAAEKAEYGEAAALLRKTISLNPRLHGAHNLLVEVLLDQGKAEEALSVGLEHRHLFPQSHEGHFWLGQAYLQLKDYENARKSHEEVLLLAPGFTLSHHSLATICIRLGDRESARQHRQQFARLKETDLQKERGRNKHFRDLPYQRSTAANTHLCAGNVHLAVGSVRKAEAHWLRASVIDPTDASCREALAMLYEQQNRLSDAVSVREQLVAIEPEQADWHNNLASLHARLEHFEAAEAAFRRAIEIAPEQVEAYLGLAKLYFAADRNIAEAARLASTAVELEPSARNYVLFSAVLDRKGNAAGALVAAEKAVKLDPHGEEPRQVYELLKSQTR